MDRPVYWNLATGIWHKNIAWGWGNLAGSRRKGCGSLSTADKFYAQKFLRTSNIKSLSTNENTGFKSSAPQHKYSKQQVKYVCFTHVPQVLMLLLFKYNNIIIKSE
jgi:hypothetical protein